MSVASKQRGRQERIEALGIPKPRFMQWWEHSNKVDSLIRVAIAAIAAFAVLVCCQTWKPPFAYRMGAVPARDLITRVTFQVPDEAATEITRTQKRRDVLALYSNRTQPIVQLRGALKDQLFLIVSATSFDQMNEDDRKAFAQFYAGDETAEPDDSPAARFALFKSVLADDPELQKVDDAVRNILQPIDEHGLLTAMQHAIDQGSQRMIRVYPAGRPADAEPFELSKVRIAQVRPELQKSLAEQFRIHFPGDAGQTVARMISEWIGQRLPDTLQYDDDLTEIERQRVAADVEPVMTTYYSGDSKLADAGKAFGPK
jgi:cyclic-di-AMP phosphodiesterase PgpH